MTILKTVNAVASIPATRTNDIYRMSDNRPDYLIPLESIGGASGIFARVRLATPPSGLSHSLTEILLWDKDDYAISKDDLGNTGKVAMVYEYIPENNYFSCFMADDTNDDGTYDDIAGGYKEFDVLTPAELDLMQGTLNPIPSPNSLIVHNFNKYRTDIVQGIPNPLVKDNKVYFGFTFDGEPNCLGFWDPRYTNRLLVIKNVQNVSDWSTKTHVSVDSHGHSVPAPGSVVGDMVITIRYNTGAVTLGRVFLNGTQPNSSIPYAYSPSRYKITVSSSALAVHPSRFKYNIIVDATDPVPAVLVPGTFYTGTTYQGGINKITFLDPKDLNKVLIIDKPVDFNTYAGGLTLLG